MAAPATLDGSTLEGGGQLLRVAIGVSSLTKIPLQIHNIRGKRTRGGGLRNQHATSVEWLGNVTNAVMTGVRVKSTEITFAPNTTVRKIGKPLPKLLYSFGQEAIHERLDYHHRMLPDGTSAFQTVIAQKTPGSIGLVFQALLPYLVYAGSSLSAEPEDPIPIRIAITGGTNAPGAPSYEYMSQVMLPMFSLVGIPSISATLDSRGWGSGNQAMGSITFTIKPLPLYSCVPAFTLDERGDIEHVEATIVAPKSYETEFRNELSKVLSTHHETLFGTRSPSINIEFEISGYSKGIYLILVATTTTKVKLGSDWQYDLDQKGNGLLDVVPTTVKRAVDKLVTEVKHGGCVDEYMRDQLVVFQALAKGKGHIDGGLTADSKPLQPSLHALTAQWVASEMVGAKFNNNKGTYDGIGLAAGEIYAERKSLARLSEKLKSLKV